MNIGLILGAIAGLAVGVYLVADYGLSNIWDALATAGWLGFTAVTIAHLAAIGLCAVAWRVLITKAPPQSFFTFFWARFLRDGMNNLLGVVPCIGEIIGARELRKNGVPAGVAGATTVIDVTTELISQLIFTLFGLAVLFYVQPASPSTWWASGGLAVAAIILLGFVVAQRNGLFRFLELLPSRLGLLQQCDATQDVAKVNAAIQDIYRRRNRVCAAIAVHVVAWLARSLEAIAALYAMDQPIGVLNVIALEALVYALRTAAFVVPSAIGVQEGSYVLVGAMFGLAPEAAIALSLLKRAREVVLGLPAVIAWQLIEVQALWGGREIRSSAPKASGFRMPR